MIERKTELNKQFKKTKTNWLNYSFFINKIFIDYGRK